MSLRNASCLVAAAAMLQLSAPQLAWAQPESAAPPPPASAVDTGDVDAINAQAVEAFKAKRYEEAARLFEDAYNVSPEPNYLFNIGRVFEESGNFPSAIEYYDRFIHEPAVELSSREVALERLRVLRAIVAEEKANEDAKEAARRKAEEDANREDEPAPPKPLAEDDDKMPPMRVGGIVLLVGGGLGLATAGIFAGLANAKNNDLEGLQPLAARREAIDTGTTRALVADVMFGVGGAMAVVGAVLVGVSYRKKNDASRASLQPVLTRQGAGLNARIRF